MEVTWLAAWWEQGDWGKTHLLLKDGNNLIGPFCTNYWHVRGWKKDPDPVKCKWCREAARWIRLVEGKPLEVLKRISGYHPQFPPGGFTEK